eukprot:735270-Amphidinium_carterae.3
MALAVAGFEPRLAQASDELRRAFYARSTERARLHKRSAVESLARAVANSSSIYPLTEHVTIGVAAAGSRSLLEKCRLRSAASYLIR